MSLSSSLTGASTQISLALSCALLVCQGLEMARSPVVACLMRDLVRGGAVGASVVAAGLLRVADVVLAEESVGKEAGESVGEKAPETARESE